MKITKQSVTKSLVEFWASAVDVMLQDLLKACTGEDAHPNSASVCCARLAQLGYLMYQTFDEGMKGCLSNSTDKEATVLACRAACEKVKTMCQRHLDNLDRDTQKMLDDDGPETERDPRLLN